MAIADLERFSYEIAFNPSSFVLNTLINRAIRLRLSNRTVTLRYSDYIMWEKVRLLSELMTFHVSLVQVQRNIAKFLL